MSLLGNLLPPICSILSLMRLIKLMATLGVVAAVGLAWALVQQKPYIPIGSKAPGFKGKATDGKDYSLESLTKDGSAFVVFWKERCPHNPRAASIFNTLKKAYGDKVNLVGFVLAPDSGTKSWSKQFGVNYPMLADADREVITSYGLSYSIVAFEIGKDGKIASVYPGYGLESMNALNADMAKAAGTPAAKVDMSKARSRQTYG